MKIKNLYLLAISQVLLVASGVIFGTMMLSQGNLDYKWLWCCHGPCRFSAF